MDKKALFLSARALLIGAAAVAAVEVQPKPVDACAACIYNGSYLYCSWIGGGNASACSVAGTTCTLKGAC